jgi:hypothetical protein
VKLQNHNNLVCFGFFFHLNWTLVVHNYFQITDSAKKSATRDYHHQSIRSTVPTNYRQ